MTAAPKVRVTDEEYLDRERRAETKSELINGEIVAMAGASARHIAITMSIGAALYQRIRTRRMPYLLLGTDQRVHVEATGLYTYPDVTVACGGPHFHPKHHDNLLNPTLIVEVLSPSTEAYDRGAKFAHYQTIPSLAEYVLISQTSHRVEHFRRLETGQWLLTVYEGDEASLDLPALGFAIPLAEIYEQLDILPEPPPT
ncbi:Uma2 family endonuclease [Chondromyces apiculatus]|uniref:Putative restriction endonuclease domain-containing protein n=1 Tax=Chondromyces apiculatus DSM 436 TaxID=1192034 RepID=A0A017T8H4_9BACT|nr:Uma2 family endonuclease [Chondromyces apiculatus]EYF04916.1 Hypothetical protein CAP_3727 [Chondromyces apiculatus DSM 436]